MGMFLQEYSKRLLLGVDVPFFFDSRWASDLQGEAYQGIFRGIG